MEVREAFRSKIDYFLVDKTKKKTYLPNLIIIGAQKCATTSLHYYLGLHPQISMSREKELDFFVFEFNWSRGIEWYKSHFTGTAKIYGETSPNYTEYPRRCGVAERMYRIVPQAKLIYILRDPIERIISHYIHWCDHGRETKKISEALAKLDDNVYVCRSQYYMQLEQYLHYFLESSILIITQEDLQDQRRQTMQKLFRFLNVDDSFDSPRFSKVMHKSDNKRQKNRMGILLARTARPIVERLPPEIRWKVEMLLYLPFSHKIERPTLDENTRVRLIDYLKDDINRLRKYTGRDFEEWGV